MQTQPVLLDVPAGSFFVSLEQPLANLAIAVLEPESPAGYAANGVIASVDQRRPRPGAAGPARHGRALSGRGARAILRL